jgi:hypothetical protein
MSVQRFLLATLCAGFLTGCAAHVPILDEQGNAAASQDAQVIRDAASTAAPVKQNMEVVHAPDGDGLGVVDPAEGEAAATATREKKRTARARKPAAMSSKVVSTDLKKPAQGSATASTKASAQQSAPESISDHAERVRRQAEEDERRERQLKKVINGICSGC